MRALYACAGSRLKLCAVGTLISMLATGCATPAPQSAQEALPDSPTLAKVNTDIGSYAGRLVRWGGSIERLENHAQETWIEIVERPLDSQGRPRESDRSGGRFIAKVAGFLDPVIYTRGRDISVAGSVDGDITRKIGEFEYRYVLVKVDTEHLWAPSTPAPVMYYDPFWYDPWYPYWPRRYRHYH